MLAMLVAACLNQTTLTIPWPNVIWVSPMGKSGRYLVATSFPDENGATFRIWPAKGNPVWFKTNFHENGAIASPDGKHVVVSGWSRSELYRLGSSKPIAKGFSTGLILGKPAALNYEERRKTTYLQYEGKQILPPARRHFLMIAQQGDWIATERQAFPRAKGEDQYIMLVELWRLTQRHKLEFVRSLGQHWWDSGSSGTPSLLTVAGNRLAFVDHPGGGNAMQFVVWVPPNKGASNPFSRYEMAMTQVAGIPLAFAKGIVSKVWVIDSLSRQHQEAKKETSIFDHAEWCLAWLDGRNVKLWTPPHGFLNGWVASPAEMGYAVEVGTRVEIRKMSMPPTGWWQPTKASDGASEERSILAIARKAVQKNDTWIDKAEFEQPRKASDGSWTVLVWRLPKTPGGHRVIRIDRMGRVIDYLRGR
ncbi:MAG: hypothetical protein H7Y17_01805 [Chlorobia bacterium]|nr:hypothetical protein [Fimbriimonadaceae bacterium]